jgi:hypothetical protein
MLRALVSQQTMGDLVVVAQPFAVIGGHDDEGIVQKVALGQHPQQRARAMVRVGHFAAIGIAFEALRER